MKDTSLHIQDPVPASSRRPTHIAFRRPPDCTLLGMETAGLAARRPRGLKFRTGRGGGVPGEA